MYTLFILTEEKKTRIKIKFIFMKYRECATLRRERGGHKARVYTERLLKRLKSNVEEKMLNSEFNEKKKHSTRERDPPWEWESELKQQQQQKSTTSSSLIDAICKYETSQYTQDIRSTDLSINSPFRSRERIADDGVRWSGGAHTALHLWRVRCSLSTVPWWHNFTIF